MTTDKQTSILDNERAFHDARFKEADTRDKLAAVYSIIGASKEEVSKIIEGHCGPGTTLLEYGCGDGIDPKLHSLGCQLYGIDISKEAIHKARQKTCSVGVLYSVGDCHATEFPSDIFDCVTGNGILHHLDLRKALEELARITYDDGICVFTEPLGHNPLINLFRWLTPKLRSPDEHPLMRSDLQLMKTYFKKVEVRHYYLFALLAVPFRRSKFFTPVYEALLRFDEKMFKQFPRLRRHSWMVLIKLSQPKKIDFRWREMIGKERG